MLGDPFGALKRDLDAVARDLDNMSEAQRETSGHLAEEISDQAPVETGYLAGSVVADGDGVGVGAPYAVFVRDPFVERGVDAVDWLAPSVDRVDAALDHIQLYYH